MSPPSLEDGNIQFPKRCALKYFVEYRTMDKVQKTSTSEIYT
jgi:hypothetical protein